jgi:hypothetical protein
VAANPNATTLHDRQQSNLDVIAQLDVSPDDHAAKRDLDVPANSVSEKRPIGPDLQRAREPAEEHEVPNRDSRPGDKRA